MVIKRDGRKVPFDKTKIEEAIYKAFKAVEGEISEYAVSKAKNIAAFIEEQAQKRDLDINTVATFIGEARKDGKFMSIDDLKIRAKIGASGAELLKQFGCLDGMSQSNQLSLFG